MTWIKLDDRAPRHPKIAGLSDRAFRWWVRGLCYASEFLTDGGLPAAFWRDVPAKVREEMEVAGLWESDPTGVRIHDYLIHQTPRANIEKERERNRRRARGSTGGTTSGDPSVNTSGDTGGTPVVLPQPEYREQSTENRSVPAGAGPVRARGVLIESPLAWDRKHGAHLTGFCDWMCFPWDLAEQFSARSQWDLSAVESWATAVRRNWEANQRIPTGKMYDFWNARWSELHQRTAASLAPAKALPPDYGPPGESYIQRTQREREEREAKGRTELEAHAAAVRQGFGGYET